MLAARRPGEKIDRAASNEGTGENIESSAPGDLSLAALHGAPLGT
jgi:hypothetical protein